MRINRKLNLVIPVDTDNGTIYVHSTPISREVFEKYFLVISKTFAMIYRQGLEVVAGPRVAAMLLKTVATDLGVWEGVEGVENGLVAEMRRLTNIVIPKDGKGWDTMGLQDAIDRDLLDEDDVSEVEGAVTFFTCASSMHRKTELPAILAGMTSLWDAQTTSSSFTEYRDFLATSTEAKPTTTTTSSVPS